MDREAKKDRADHGDGAQRRVRTEHCRRAEQEPESIPRVMVDTALPVS